MLRLYYLEEQSLTSNQIIGSDIFLVEERTQKKITDGKNSFVCASAA